MKKAFALLLVAALTPFPAFAQQAAGVVTTLDGQARVARATAPPANLSFKSDVFMLDRITTGEQSLVKMLLGGKALVTVRELSGLTITESVGRSVITLDNGKIAYGLLKKQLQPGETHEIRTPNAIASVRGTVVVVEVERKSAQGPGGGAVPAITHVDVLPPLPGQPPPSVFASFIGGTLLQILGGRGRTFTGNIVGPDRPNPPNLMQGMSARTKSAEGQKPKTDPNKVNSDTAGASAGPFGGESMPGSASDGGARKMPGNEPVIKVKS